MILAKWLSLVNHIHNKHAGHSQTFPKCLHPELYSHKKKWLKPRKYIVSLEQSMQIITIFSFQIQKLVRRYQIL